MGERPKLKKLRWILRELERVLHRCGLLSTRLLDPPGAMSLHTKDGMMILFARFLKDEAGATAIEYGLIAAGIAVAIIAVVQGLGSQLNTTFTTVQTALK